MKVPREKASRRVIEVPSSDYQPTAAEMKEPIKPEGAQDVTFEKAVQRLLRPVDMREVPSTEWRKRRKPAR